MTGESDESELTRRDALEKGGSVAAFGSFGLLGGAAKAQSKGDEPDWDVTGVDWLEGSEVGQNLKYAMSGKYAGDLKKKIQSAGFRPAPKRAAAGQINTSSAEVNATRPVQLLLPFVPKGQKKKDGDLSGLIIATVAGQNNDRQLVNAVGSTVEGPEGDRTAKLYGNTSESGVDIGVIRETKANGSQVGTSQSLPCATCQLIVGNICAFVSGKVTSSVCPKTGVVCAGAGGGVNIPAGLGCMGACYLIIGTLSAYGCFYAPGYICSKVEEVPC